MKSSQRLVLCFLCAAFLPAFGWTFTNEMHKTDYDHAALKGQKRSLLQWSEDPKDFLDIKRWILERDLKDLEPGWKVRQRLTAQPERVGKVVSCIGDCQLFRGTTSTRVRWLSHIQEGDEIHTAENSYLWAMLVDGTLVRVAPESSLGFLEVNIANDRVFFHARLNQGYVHWQPRSGRTQKLTDARETDPLFLPLMDPEANVEWFQTRIYQGETAEEQMALTTSVKPLGQSGQQKALNELILENNEFLKARSHQYLLVAPNGSFQGENIAVSWFYSVSNMSYFKLMPRDDEEEGERLFSPKSQFLYRGYSNESVEEVTPDQWYAVDRDGRSLGVLSEVPPQLALSELMPRRITTLMLARENWLSKDKTIWADAATQEKLAVEWGYRLWGSELDVRKNFLREYTRRIETTNLRSLQKLTDALAKEGSFKMGDFDERYFSRSLEAYYTGLKRRHSIGKESVRDMIPLHYYGWMLKNAQQQ